MQIPLKVLLIFAGFFHLAQGTPESSENWEELVATDGVKFSARNAHASCVFKGRIWVTGGRTAKYVTWDLVDAFSVADVWSSANGAIWRKESFMTGDYWAQNEDVLQYPGGSVAPWYARYGHSMDAIDIDNDGEPDMMILCGGYATSPSNDVWVTLDGSHWIYTGLAPWTPRAWHQTVIFDGLLYLMGGTPLNSEVWRLTNVTLHKDRRVPLTRALYSDFTYDLTWERLPDAPWSPRAGMNVVSHWFFNTSKEESEVNSRERMILIGGYGGCYEEQECYDDFHCRADTWATYDGFNWDLLVLENSFGARAWSGAVVQHADNPRYDVPMPNGNITNLPPKIFLYGGGYIGTTKGDKKIVSTMQGKADGYWSRDGVYWNKINYEEGGGTTGIPYYSSQEWSKTVVDTATRYIGMWGFTVESFNSRTKQEYPGDLILIAGDYTGAGEYSSAVYRSIALGVICDVEGIICNGNGVCLDPDDEDCTAGCTPNGCVCKEYEDVITRKCKSPFVAEEDDEAAAAAALFAKPLILLLGLPLIMCSLSLH